MTTQTDAAQSTPESGGVADLYRAVLPMLDFTAEETKLDQALRVQPADLHGVIAASRDDERLSMDLLRNLTAVDWQDDGIEVVYHLYSLRYRHGVCIKTRLTGDAPAIATITDLHMGAEWAEREVREMFGVEFEGHPDPRNLLLDEDLDIHPLLKSHPLAEIELPQGVDVEYFTKEHPPDRRPSAQEAAKAAPAAAKAADEKKAASDLTPEELAAKRAEQAERVKRARELAAARRAEGPKTPMGEKAAAAPKAAAPAAEAPPAAETAPPPPAAPAAPAAPKKAAADMSPAELDERKQAQAERVKRARELAAARRRELRGEG